MRWGAGLSCGAAWTLAAAGAVEGPAAPRKLKVYVSVDMEGIAGTVTSDQLGPDGFEYARFREFMTREVAGRGAGGAGGGSDRDPDRATPTATPRTCSSSSCPPDVRMIRSWPRPLAMMAGSTTRSTPPFFSATTRPPTTRTASGPTRSEARSTRTSPSTESRSARAPWRRRSRGASACPSSWSRATT